MVEKQAQSLMQFYEGMMRGITTGVLLLDAQGDITFANKSAADLLGVAQQELLGVLANRFVPDALLRESTLLPYCETAVRDVQGTHHPVWLAIQPLQQANNGTRMVSMVSVANMQQFNDALFHTQRLAGVGTLTASVAHELTNPLSIITATCSNLVHEVNSNNLDTDVLLHYIQMIEQSAWRSARIVEVLRHYTHDSGLNTAVTDLNMIIEDTLTLVRPQFHKEFNVEIKTDLNPDLRSIVCDHNRMTQVLINLLTNARDAMQPDGGLVEIKSWSMRAPAPSAPPDATHPPLADYFAFSVRDHGPGIPPDVANRIFDPFFTTKPSGAGMGLGLFITRRIVEEHNGRIWAENNPHGGATFTVLLPQQKENAPH